MQRAHKAAWLVPSKRRLDGAELLKIIVRLWKTTLKKSDRSPFAYELKKYNCPVSVMDDQQPIWDVEQGAGGSGNGGAGFAGEGDTAAPSAGAKANIG